MHIQFFFVMFGVFKFRQAHFEDRSLMSSGFARIFSMQSNVAAYPRLLLERPTTLPHVRNYLLCLPEHY